MEGDDSDPEIMLERTRVKLRHAAHVLHTTLKNQPGYAIAVELHENAAIAFAMASAIVGRRKA